MAKSFTAYRWLCWWQEKAISNWQTSEQQDRFALV
jgi:hypothetical protein